MFDPSHTIDEAADCATCGGAFGKSRYVQEVAALLYAFCSHNCYRLALREQARRRWEVRRRQATRLAIGLVVVGAWLTPHQGPPRPRPVQAAQMAAALPPADDPGKPRLPPGWFGPEWPPTETSMLAALGRDAWVHPLAGPVRRMPLRDSRVFGASRPGDRATECRNGHCGVDLGGEIWGEHVHAVHDGVVDFVQRGANPNRGGRFVRLAHHNGTVFTQYFHLAAIPHGLERGQAVKSGQVIGLLGDTGVKESAPHLHFAISIRPIKDGYEKYIDPEPLIALWPLRVPVDGGEVGLVTLVAKPGVPLGSMPLLASHRRARAQRRRAVDDGAGSARGAASPSDEGEGTGDEGASSESGAPDHATDE